MPKQEFFIQRPAVTPTIYVYNLPQVTTHKGYVKVGYEDFLIERRKLMAAKIKAAFEILKKAAT